MIRESLKDHNNKPSSFRFVWLITCLTVVFVWAYISLSKGVIQHLTVGDTTAFLILIGGKPAASFIEKMKKD
jgi:hypothetical protein